MTHEEYEIKVKRSIELMKLIRSAKSAFSNTNDIVEYQKLNKELKNADVLIPHSTGMSRVNMGEVKNHTIKSQS